MNFPVVILKKGKSPIYFFSEQKFGLISKGGEIFYKQGVIYDSDGNEFLLSGFESRKKAGLIKSLMYFQPMYIVKPVYTDVGKITLPKLKALIIEHIVSHKSYWIRKDVIANLTSEIESSASFTQLFKFLE